VVTSTGNDVRAPAFDAGRAEDLTALLDALPSMVVYIDRDGINRYANAAVAHWLRRPVEDVVGVHVRDVLGEDGYRAVAGRMEAAQHGQPQKFVRALPTADGAITYSLTEYVPRLRDGRPDGFYALNTDITGRVLADRASSDQDIRSAELEHRARRALAASDDLLQQLYAVGLHLDRLSRHPHLLDDLAEPVLKTLQETITGIRASITAGALGGDASPGEVVRQLVAGWSARTGADPVVVVDGRVDDLSPESARRVLTALSEILGTAARHLAGPFRVEVLVNDGAPVVRIDGQDWPAVARSELSHLSYAEREDGGRLEVDGRRPGLTRVSWSRATA
jgi:PAS domain S-box-containing protein